MALDPDARAELEEERDFLLRSLSDLDEELAAGDIDAADHGTLSADYTARAAAVLRALEGGSTTVAPTEKAAGPRRWRRRLVTVFGVAAVAALAGVLVTQASGRRGSSGPTGLDVGAVSAQLDECQALDRDGETEDAVVCYSEILEERPGNSVALTFRGWLQVREGDIDDGLADLDAAIDLDPSGTAPYLFRASGRARTGDAPGAVADLVSFEANEPTGEERQLAEQFTSAIVPLALDACIAGDVDGSMPLVEVLQCYRNIIEVEPGHPTASVYLGWLLARSGLAEDALALLDDGLEADPSLSAGYVFRAAVRAHLGDVAGAQEDLATFDSMDAPGDQVAAAAQVRTAIEAGEDPLAGGAAS